MKRMKEMMFASVLSLFLAIPAWAAEDVPPSNAVKIVSGLLPLIIIFGLLYFFLRRINRRNGPYMDRAMTHMERLEKQNEEIIGLLKAIAGRKSLPEQSPPPLPRDTRAGRSEGEG